MGNLKLGVVGVGSLGAIHARIFSQLEGVQLVAVADSDLKKAKKIVCIENNFSAPLTGLIIKFILTAPKPSFKFCQVFPLSVVENNPTLPTIIELLSFGEYEACWSPKGLHRITPWQMGYSILPGRR